MTYTKQVWSDFPNQSTPLSAARMNHLETQFDRAREYVDSKTLPSATRGSSTIKHVISEGVNYEVIRVSGGFGAIDKVQPPGVSPDGTVPGSALMSPREAAFSVGASAVSNCDAFAGGGVVRSVGLHIAGGVAYQNFGVQSTSAEGSDREALLLMRDGSLVKASRSDGLTAQQYVNQGAYASFGYGPVLVEGGTLRQWWTLPEFSGFTSSLSARTILGQASNGDYIIITVEGKSGEYGITGRTLSDIALQEGCYIAINLDGGGSTQTVWMGDLIHASSDASPTRNVMTYLAVFSPCSNTYDSGDIAIPVASGITPADPGLPALSVRQRGGQISMQFSALGSFPEETWVTVSRDPIPQRYTSSHHSYMRGVVYGTSGLAMGISYGTSSGMISARTRTGPTGGNLDGVITYPARG